MLDRDDWRKRAEHLLASESSVEVEVVSRLLSKPHIWGANLLNMGQNQVNFILFYIASNTSIYLWGQGILIQESIYTFPDI